MADFDWITCPVCGAPFACEAIGFAQFSCYRCGSTLRFDGHQLWHVTAPSQLYVVTVQYHAGIVSFLHTASNADAVLRAVERAFNCQLDASMRDEQRGVAVLHLNRAAIIGDYRFMLWQPLPPAPSAHGVLLIDASSE